MGRIWKKLTIVAVIISGVFQTNLFAEEKKPVTEKSMEELSKELANPLAQIWNLSFMYNYTNVKYDLKNVPKIGDVKGTDHLNVGVFQPVLPIPLGDKYTFFARPVIPIIEGPTHVSIDNNGHLKEDRDVKIGDIMLPIGAGVVRKEGWSWGGGITFMLPTSQNDLLGSKQYEVGPTALLLYANEDWTVGTHFQHWWGFAKADGYDDKINGLEVDRNWGNHTDIQYFIVKNLPNAWQIRTSPHITIDWTASGGEQVTLPIGIGVGKMVKIGPMPVMLMAEYQYSVIAPKRFKNQSIIMLQANFIIKNPFGVL